MPVSLHEARDLYDLALGWATNKYPRGDAMAKSRYQELRDKIAIDPSSGPLLPECIKAHLTLGSFFDFIKESPYRKAGERHEFLAKQFTPLLTFLEERQQKAQLKDAPLVLKRQSELVKTAISSAERDVEAGQPVGGLDRMHTALHGYLRCACQNEQIDCEPDASMNKLFKLLRSHPSLTGSDPHSKHVNKVINGMGTIIDAFNPIRNHASIAHPNDDLLGKPEASLVIDAARALLRYLDAKLAVDE
jgi:hypothetical protein